MKERLAMFDFDGTLYDTMPANFFAYRDVLTRHGFSLDETYFARQCYGKNYRDFLPPIIGSDPDLLGVIHREKLACYPDYLDQIRENTSLFDLLHALRPKYYTALVTTASRVNIMSILERFGRKDSFDLILTQEDIPHSKPAPDGFLMAMEHFNIPAECSIIFEDSESGISAAKASGAQYFVVQGIR